MKHIAALSILLVCAYAGVGQSPSSILKKAEKALGASALKKVSSIRETGTITRVSDGASGKFILQSARPNMLNISFDLAGFEVESGYNGRSSWERDSREGLQTLTGRDSNVMQAKAAYRNSLWLNAKNEKAKLTSGGTANVNGRQANIVIYTSAKGVSIKIYVDTETALILRDEVPKGDAVETSDYSDYRNVGGVRLPYAIRASAGDRVYEIKLDDVQTNVQVARSEFDYPADSKAPLPDVNALLKEVQANEDRVDGILDNYSYKQKSITREVDKTGKIRETDSETVQLSFYKGYRIRRQIEKDGKPLTASDQAKEDKDVQKQVEDIEKKIAKKESKNVNGPPSENDNRRVSIAEVLRASKLINPRRERFGGRDCVVFDFEPNPEFDLKNAKTALKFFGKTAGVMWIDEQDKQVARVEAVLYDSYNVGGGVLAKINKGAAFTLEKERFNDEIWLPATAEINLSIRLLLVKGLSVNQLIRSYDYHRFETEVKGATVGDDKP